MRAGILKESIRICNFLGDSVNDKTGFEYVPDEFAVRFAEYNQLVALFYSALENRGVCEGEAPKLAILAERELIRQLRNDALQEKICKEFEKNGIFYGILKGTETRKFYPEYLMRTSNDIDLYVSPEAVYAATKALESLGLEYVRTNSDGDELEFQHGGSYVELHISMGGITKRQKRLFAKMAQKASVGLTSEDQYIYSVFHLYKHFITAGAGVRMFLDVYCIGKTEGMDRMYIKKALKKLGISRFENIITEINETLFESKEGSDEIYEILGYIFEHGAYGSESAATHLRYAGAQISKQSSFKHLIGDLCLDGDSMKKRYGILNRCILLYPFCVIHRLVKGAIFRKKTLEKAVSSARETAVQREHYSRILKISGIL